MLWEFLLLGALPLYIFRKLKKLKKNEIVPSKVRFIKVDNSINDITKEFNK